jgi:hypothetical protein
MTSNNYTKAIYTVAIEVAKSPKDIFNHLLHDIAEFWPEDVEGEGSKLNDEFIFKTGNSHYSKNKVIELVPNKKLVWLVTDSYRKMDNFEWTGTKMIFELVPHADQTEVIFTYDGVILMSESERLFQVCDFVIKENLFKSLSTGKAAPLHPPNKSFTATIELEKPPHDVFNCLKEVAKWWSRDFEGKSARIDDEFVISHPGRHFSKQKLVELIPDHKLVWQVTESYLDWLEKDKQEWTDTKMIFELIPKRDHTMLHFTHEGLVPEKECFSMCEKGWNMVIRERLFSYITEGKEI